MMKTLKTKIYKTTSPAILALTFCIITICGTLLPGTNSRAESSACNLYEQTSVTKFKGKIYTDVVLQSMVSDVPFYSVYYVVNNPNSVQYELLQFYINPTDTSTVTFNRYEKNKVDSEEFIPADPSITTILIKNFNSVEISSGETIYYSSLRTTEEQDETHTRTVDLYDVSLAPNYADYTHVIDDDIATRIAEDIFVNGLYEPIDFENPNFRDEAYNLTGFTGDNAVNASWTGTTERSYLKDVEVDEHVMVCAGYAYKSQPGQIATRITLDKKFLTADKLAFIARDSLQHDNDTIFLRYLQYYPMYSVSDSIFSSYYYGSPSTIWFNMDGSINYIEYPGNPGSYNALLPNVSGLKYNSITPKECHGEYSVDCVTCFALSWDIPKSAEPNDYYEVKMLAKYNYTTHTTSGIKYGTQLFDLTKLSDTVLVTNGMHNFCTRDIKNMLDIDNLTSFDLNTVQKIYIRYVRKVNGLKMYGNWSIYSMNKDKSLSLDYNSTSVGDGVVIPGYEDIDNNGGYDSEILEEIKRPQTEDKDGLKLNGLDLSDLSGIFSTFTQLLSSLLSFVGQFPAMFSTVFSFLPSAISSSIVLVFYISIIIGLIKIFT